MAKHIIIFQYSNDDDSSLIGFKLLNQKAANQYMKAVSLLSESNEQFEICNKIIEYDTENFEMLKLTSGDLKVISKLFNIEDEDELIGIIPDAINDAYELRIIFNR